METYVIMSRRSNAVYSFDHIPVFVCFSKKTARKKVIELNMKAKTNIYWSKKVGNNSDLDSSDFELLQNIRCCPEID